MSAVGPVNTISEALADPQLRARGMTTHGSYGAAEGEGDALRYTPLVSDAPFTLRHGLPILGADTADALKEAGYTRTISRRWPPPGRLRWEK